MLDTFYGIINFTMILCITGIIMLPANKVWEVYRNHSNHVHIFFYGGTLKAPTLHKDCL